MPRTQPRRGRFSPVAAVALLSSLAVVALALWGLQRDPLPAAADFGSPTPAAPSPAGGSEAAGAAVDPVPTAAPPQDGGAVVEQRPGTRDASIPDEPDAATSPPVRLLVPDLGLDVPLDAVGVTDDGLMEVPEDADRAGWYRFGPSPGDDTGSAVLAGHVDDREGPGAFMALTEAQEDMRVVVEHDDGSRTDYTVTARRTTDKKELPVDDLFDRDGPPLLQLVTCTGPWSERAGSYRDNLVVTATPVG